MSFFSELKRRNIFRVGLVYAMASWLVLQVVDVVGPLFELQSWVARLIFLLLALGLPVTLVLTWIFEWTPEGIKRDSEVIHDQRSAAQTGRKLNFVIIGIMAVALIYFVLNHNWGGDAGGRSVGTASGQSVAVLPFLNRSAIESDVFFVDGVHDDLLTLLSKLGGLKVISRTSVERFRDTRLDIRELARQLGVATVLEGAVQRAGGQVHINVQLIDAVTDEHLWAETYDRELTAQNIFAIQSDIAQTIARALQAVLTPEEQSRVTELPTSSYAAYEEYLRGRQKLVLREIPDIRQAVEHFHQSIRLDPDYAMAYVGLADAYHLLLYYGDMSPSEALPLMEAAVNTALEINPNLGEAQAALGAALRYTSSSDAVVAYEKAIELAPGYATSYHWLAEHYRFDQLKPEKALSLIIKAQELDPLSPVINITVAETLAQLGRGQEALAQIDHVIEVSPDYASAYVVKSDIMASSFGRLDEALRLSDHASELDPQSLNACLRSAQLLSQMGDDASSIEKLMRCLELGPDYYFSQYNAAKFYLLSGDSEQALHHVRRAYAMRPGYWLPKRILRDFEIDRGESAKARERYESFNPEFVGPGLLTVTLNNYGAVNDYALLLLQAGEKDRLPQILLPLLDFLPQVSRRGPLGMGIDDVRALAMLGENEKAIQALEKAVAEGWRFDWRLLLEDRSLDSIREDPRFIAQKEIIKADMAAQLNSYRSE